MVSCLRQRRKVAINTLEITLNSGDREMVLVWVDFGGDAVRKILTAE